jgi:LysR family hydrogen peroxide-inducible transcriptional activator
MEPLLAGLSLRDLEYALAVEELRHFGRAAERCGVSQPALSEQIRKLEGVLRISLFERSPRGVEPTPEGIVLLRHARDVVREARGLLATARHRGDPLASTLRLGVIPTLGPYYLPTMLRSLRIAFPDLSLRLEEGMTARIVERLQLGTLDCVLVALPVVGAGLASRTLFFEPFELVAPVGHRLSSLPFLTLPDLEQEDFLLLEEGHCLRDQALSLCRSVPGRSRRYASSLEMLRHMIAAGEGFSLLPLLSLRDGRDLEGLATIRGVDEAVPAPLAGRLIALAWRSRDPRAGAFAQLAEFLASNAPDGTRPPDTPDPAEPAAATAQGSVACIPNPEREGLGVGSQGRQRPNLAPHDRTYPRPLHSREG